MFIGSRKRHFLFSAVFIILFAAGFYIYCSPRPVVENPSAAHIDFVSYRGAGVAGFNEKEIIGVLSEYECSRTFKSYFPYDTGNYEIEIDGSVSGIPIHLMIGESVSIVYESADSGVYKINDRDQDFRDKILWLLAVE